MRSVRASLAVEAALVFPFIAVVLFYLLQSGLVLTEQVFCRSLCCQGAALYAEARRSGYSDRDAKELVKKQLEKKIRTYFPEGGEASVETETAGLGRRVRVTLSAEYGFLFPMRFSAAATGGYRSPTAVRDSVCLVREIGAKIPEIGELKSKLKEKLGEWEKEQ